MMCVRGPDTAIRWPNTWLTAWMSASDAWTTAEGPEGQAQPSGHGRIPPAAVRGARGRPAGLAARLAVQGRGGRLVAGLVDAAGCRVGAIGVGSDGRPLRSGPGGGRDARRQSRIEGRGPSAGGPAGAIADGDVEAPLGDR